MQCVKSKWFLHSYLFKINMLGWSYAQNIQILFWAKYIANKPSLFVVFGYNNCSVSNQNDFQLIPSQNEHDGMGICAKHTNFIHGGSYSWKTPFLVVFDYNNCSVSNRNDFYTHTSSKSTCWDGDIRKTYKFYSKQKILLKNLHYLTFLAITIAVCQIQMILTLIRLQNEHDGIGICAKHTNFIQSGNQS